MKAGLLTTVAGILGLAVGLGMTWSEFRGVSDDFAPYSGAAPETKGEIAPGEERPRVVVLNGEEHDFGSMERFGKRSHSFQFKNAGNAPLTLEVGDTTCKCTVGGLEQSQVQPGEVVDVTLTWTAETADRHFHQYAEILTNDVRRPKLSLEIKGVVTQTVMAEPEEIHLGNVRITDNAPRRIRVLGFRDDDLQLVRTELTNPKTADYFDITAVRSELTASERETYTGVRSAVDVDVRLKLGLPIGPINQTIRLVVNVPDTEPIEIPVHGTVVSDVSILGGSNFLRDKNALLLGIVKRDDGATAKLHLLVKGEQRHEVELSIGQVDPAHVLNVQIGGPIERDKVILFPLTIEIPPGSPAVNRLGSEQAKMGRIVIETTHPQAKEVPLYVAFAVEG